MRGRTVRIVLVAVVAVTAAFGSIVRPDAGQASNLHGYVLASAGRDGVFGTGDDVFATAKGEVKRGPLDPGLMTSAVPSASTASSTADEEPLPAPVNLRAVAIDAASVMLAWDPVAGAAAYAVYRGGDRLGETPETGYQVSDLSADTTYEFAVSAVSALGREGQRSAAITVRTRKPEPILEATASVYAYKPSVRFNDVYVGQLMVGDGASSYDHRSRTYVKIAGTEGLKSLRLVLNRHHVDPYGTSLTVSVHPVAQDWDPKTISWNSMPLHDSSVEIRLTLPNVGSQDVIDLTPLLEYWKTHRNYGIVIKATDERDLSLANHVNWYDLGTAKPPELSFAY